MTKHTFSAETRKTLGRAVRKLRAKGIVPGSVFGHNVKSANIQFDTKLFQKLYKQVGESTLIYLTIEGEKEPRPVLVSEVVVHPVTGNTSHVSFHQVNLKEKVTAHVSIRVEGEAPAEKEKLGILVQHLDELEIEALPTDMPEFITIDVSALSEEGQTILVSDLLLDKTKLNIKTGSDTLIVKIEPLAKEEVVVAPVAPVEAEVAVPTTENAVASTPAKPSEQKKN
jgi:large subunit ribosomal protein L25